MLTAICILALVTAALSTETTTRALPETTTTRSPRTTTKSPVTTRGNPNNIILGATLSSDEILKIAREARGDDVDKCLSLTDSNHGYKFKNTASLQGVTFQTCPGGRDCARLIRCSSKHPNICFEAVECFDPADKKRCVQLEACQCNIGDFSLVDAPNGIRFSKDVVPFDGTRKFKSADADANLPLVKRERCFDGDTFNIRACKPLETGCEAVLPCLTSDQRSCKQLVPGM